MRLIPVKTPGIVKKLFPNYIWNVKAHEKVIYLTFDDGPTPKITPWTLNVLKQYHAKATFFCIGNNIEKHPEIFNAILEAGHAIGNHTQNHVKGWRCTTDNYLDNIKIAEGIIDSQTSKKNLKYLGSNTTALEPNISRARTILSPLKGAKLFRPPYGQITPKQGKALIANGYQIIMWDILSFDWEINVKPETCLQNIIKKTSAGSIIVFHDSVKASRNMRYALPRVLEYFSNKGYRFETLNSDLK